MREESAIYETPKQLLRGREIPLKDKGNPAYTLGFTRQVLCELPEWIRKRHPAS
jgi:hypothetical protein